MEVQQFLDHVARGRVIEAGSDAHQFMHSAAQEALRTCAELNGGYHPPDEERALLSRLTGRSVDASVTVFPPLYSEFGKNLRLGTGVFINIGCRFQDTGGITIGDGTLIGHGSTLTTLNHDVDPSKRGSMTPAPVVVGRDVWIGADMTVVPGVTIGDGAIVGAGSGRHAGRACACDRRWGAGAVDPADRVRALGRRGSALKGAPRGGAAAR